MNERRRKATRLKERGYAEEGMYSVTICTEGMQYLLGYKEDEHIHLTDIGWIVEEAWQKIGSMYDGVVLDAFVVMPNHIHGIIVLHGHCENRKPLPQIIRNFKAYTTRRYYEDKFRITGNLWHRSYFEHVIRYNEFDIIREYINNNPANWENDGFFQLEFERQQSMYGPDGPQKVSDPQLNRMIDC